MSTLTILASIVLSKFKADIFLSATISIAFKI
uniref:Uncharacterized protein n=1 Tax=Myoviridae sp. ctjhW4 TaxID=2825162 RepID=A0A8S5PTX7_9CAUD|nr:MAG TPA: hypothetical protein [Myoviridae sp. ctjhW4]